MSVGIATMGMFMPIRQVSVPTTRTVYVGGGEAPQTKPRIHVSKVKYDKEENIRIDVSIREV